MNDFPTFTPRQMEFAEAVAKHRYSLYGGAAGGGKLGKASQYPIVKGKESSFTADRWGDKMFSMDSKILMWNGIWKPLSLIVVGDRIMNPDGQPQEVIAVHDHGKKQFYRVTFEDGTSTECGAEHLWGFWEAGANSRKKSCFGSNPVVEDATPRGWNTNYIRRARVRDTAWMMNAISNGKRLIIPINAPLNYTGMSRATADSAYALGLMIGNGSLTLHAEFGTADKETLDWLVAWNGPDVKVKKYAPEDRVSEFNITQDWYVARFSSNSKVGRQMLNSGLIGKKSIEKEIPEGFLTAPLPVRWGLAQGLFDTDGHASKTKRDVSISTSSPRLHVQICSLLRSLGFMAKVRKKESPTFRNQGRLCHGHCSWEIHAEGNHLERLFRLKRKKDLAEAMGDFNDGVSWPGKRVVSIEPTDIDFARCITVAHPNGLYITDDFIVTHNSFAIRWLILMGLINLYTTHKVKNAEAGLFCETYPALEGRQMAKIRAEMDMPWLGTWNQSRHSFTLAEHFGGGILRCLNLDSPDKYRSNEWAIVGVDELTLNPRSVFDALIWRLRWPGVEKPRFIAGTNPSGCGHQWVRKLWVDRDFKGEPPQLNPEEFAYIPAKATDNPHLPQSYFTDTLGSLPEHMRKALMDGSWDVIEGQYFVSWDGSILIKPPRPYQEGITDKWGIPLSWQRVGGIDWGRAAPWAALEAAIDEEGRLIVYRCCAEANWEHEQQAEWLMKGDPRCVWYADDACWAKGSANSKQARATDMSHYELWMEASNGKLSIYPAKKGDRVAGWNHLDSFFKRMPPIKNKDGTETVQDRAWIEFYDTPAMRGPHGPILTIPKLIHDPDRPEDLDTDGDEHAADALRYLCLSRPQPQPEPPKPKRPWGNEYKPMSEAEAEAKWNRVGKTVVGDW